MARAASRVTLGCHCIPLMTSDSDPHAARRVHGTPLDPENEPPIGVSWLPRLCGLTDQRIERIALDRCECIAPGREEMGNCRSGGLGVPWQFPHLFEFRHRQRFAREQRSAPSVRSVRSASPSALMPATWPQRANATQARGRERRWNSIVDGDRPACTACPRRSRACRSRYEPGSRTRDRTPPTRSRRPIVRRWPCRRAS